MRVAVTGTPGTGKTTATAGLETALDVIHLNDVIRDRGLTTGTDADRDTLIADVDALRAWLDGRDDILVESHLAHRLDVDRVIVLRCRPDELSRRLRERGEPTSMIEENAESEALDGILSAAVAAHGRERVYEIDTTELDPTDVTAEIAAVIEGRRDPSAGTVSFTDYL